MSNALSETIAGEINTRSNMQKAIVNKSFTSSAISLIQGDIKLADMPTIGEQASVASAFILGHPTYGKLGTITLGGTLSYTTVKISNPNNRWVTYLTSKEMDYWKDTSKTTGTVDTINMILEFAGGKTVQTNMLTTESNNITKATLSLGSTAGVGVLTYYLSADNGTSFDIVTPNIEHTFSTAGTNLKLKIYDGDRSGTVNIYVKDSLGNKTPIKIEYE
jgi:hypothetical protein